MRIYLTGLEDDCLPIIKLEYETELEDERHYYLCWRIGGASDLIDVENVVSVVDPEDRVGGVPVKTVHSEEEEINSLRCVSVPKGVQRN